MLQRLSPITRRLLPLYIAAFMQGLPLWYAIEKLFMTEIGFNSAGIGVMVAIMSIVMLAVETPSGILADRWSRRGVMLLGDASLFLCALIGGLSYTQPVYILSTVFWGVAAAFYSGTFDSVIYDITLEEEGNSKHYQKYLARLRIFEGTAFIIGALAGGLVASTIGMRATFFVTMPFIVIGSLILLRFREPTLHKAEVSEPVFRHIRQTFAAVLRNKFLLPVIISLVGFTAIQEAVFELSQLWFIALATPLALYGLISAVVFSTWSIGGLLTHKFHKSTLSAIGLAGTFAGLLTLIFSRNYWLILAAQFVLGTTLLTLSILLTKEMHDELPSRLRAGASSVVSTLARIVLIPGSLAITALAQETTIFAASYLLLAAGIISAIAYSFTAKHPTDAKA